MKINFYRQSRAITLYLFVKIYPSVIPENSFTISTLIPSLKKIGKGMPKIESENQFLMSNIARSEQSSHTPGGSHQRLKQFQRKDKIVKDFIFPNQVNSEKTLMKYVHMCCISVKGKNENLNKVGKMRISTLIFIYTIHFAYLKVYTKFHNPKLSSC